MPDLIARKDQRYATRMLKAGDPFQASNRDARLLVALKRAHPAPPTPAGPTIEKLQADAEAAGVKVDKRWGADRLKDEIAKAKG